MLLSGFERERRCYDSSQRRQAAAEGANDLPAEPLYVPPVQAERRSAPTQDSSAPAAKRVSRPLVERISDVAEIGQLNKTSLFAQFTVRGLARPSRHLSVSQIRRELLNYIENYEQQS